MTEKRPRWAGPTSLVCLGLVAVMAVVAAWLGLRRPPGFQRFDLGTLAFEATFLCSAPVGALIVSRRPRHAVGWLMLAVSLLAGVGAILAEASRQLYSRPALAAAMFIASDTLFKATFTALGVLVLVFPTGRLPSRRWRWSLLVAAVALGLAIADEVTSPGPISDFAASHPVSNPFAVQLPGAQAIGLAALVGYLGFLVSAAASIAVRSRRGGPEVRLQIKWFALAAALLVTAHVIGNLYGLVANHGRLWDPLLVQLGELAAAAAMAAAIAVAILRHRLFDIELATSRAVAYGALAVLIGAFYAAVVAGVGSLLTVGSSSRLLLAVVATAAVAVAFQPLRARLERLANRLVYGRRAAPYEVLADFTSRLGRGHGPTVLLPAMARTLAHGTGSDAATVWISDEAGDIAASSFPEEQIVSPSEATRSVSVEHSGSRLGSLAVLRRSGQPLAPTEERLMDGLATQAGLVLHNVGLQEELGRRLEELRESRRRLVAAQDEARRRLERDLHDGAQQSLISLRMKLGLAASVARNKPAELEPLLMEMQGELGEALDSLRTLARGVHPPLLEAEGLRAALRARARQLPVSVDVQCGDERYPRELEGAVYFCCSEALQNVAKHSRATRGSVRVWRADGRLCFEVRDDGRGMDTRGPTRPGGGLQNLQDRLDALGGRMEVASTPGAGSSVVGWLPLAADLRNGPSHRKVSADG